MSYIGNDLATDQVFLPDGVGAVSRTIPSKLKDAVSIKDFGAVGDGITDDTAAIIAASNTGKYVQFSEGVYKIVGTVSPTAMRWFSTGGAVIKFGETDQLVSDGITVDVEGLVFEGPFSAAQYTDGITNATVKTAFDTPEYLDGADAVYAGADFTHTQVGSYWSLSLASLTGTTRRSIQSSFITLNTTDRYVVHVGTVFGQYANFGEVTILRYDASNTYLGTYDPASSGENLCLTGTAKIKIRVTLRRTAKSPTINPQYTELRTNEIQFFKLANDAATQNLDTGFASTTHWQLGSLASALIQNCEFRYMGKAPILIASCSRCQVLNNKVLRCWTGFGSTSSSDIIFSENFVDLRQLHTNGNLYNLKFLRHRCFGGYQTNNFIIKDNVGYGANWATEVIAQTGLQAVIINNTFNAEIAGISLQSGTNSAITGNTITIADGWARYGIELPETHVNVDASGNSIAFGNTCSSVGIGISISTNSLWVNGKISNNLLSCPVGIYAAATSSNSTSISITGNTCLFSACGVFVQFIGATLSGNIVRKLNDMYISYITNAAVTSIGTQEIVISNNKIQSGPEGVLSILHDNAKIKGNTISASTVLPALITATVNTEHTYTDNIISGSVPTAYFSYSGSGTAFSLNNRTTTGNVILLGNSDERYSTTVTTNGVGSPVVHTATTTLLGTGTYLITARVSVNDSNHLVLATFLFQNGLDLTFDASGVSQLGTTVTSTGSPLVGTATLTATFNITTRVATFTLTQSGGSTPVTGNWAILTQKLVS